MRWLAFALPLLRLARVDRPLAETLRRHIVKLAKDRGG
jgi:hypothetical protein